MPSSRPEDPNAGSDGELPARAVVFLNDLPEDKVDCVLDADGKMAFGKSATVGGQKSPHALFTHPPPNGSASVTYVLGSRYRSFNCRVAINDTAGQEIILPLTFAVIGDGRTLWRSKQIERKGATDSCSVDVTNLKRVDLVVECPGPNENAHAVWLEPALRN